MKESILLNRNIVLSVSFNVTSVLVVVYSVITITMK